MLRTQLEDRLIRCQSEQATCGSEADDDHEAFDQLAVFHAPLVDQLRRELRGVETAIYRAMLGLYGWCADCGSRIPEERLIAAPTAIRCVVCQTRNDGSFLPPGPRRRAS